MFDFEHNVVVISSAAVGAIAGWLLGRSQRFSDAKRTLRGNQCWMTEQELCVVSGFIAAGHGHLLSYWSGPGTNDDAKRDLLFMVLASMERTAHDLERFRIGLVCPPAPQKLPKFIEAHGDLREDPYYWLRDDLKRNPLVLDHLKAENAYVKAIMASTHKLQRTMYDEMRQRVQEDDITAPRRLQSYYYYTKTVEGKHYGIHCRRSVGENAEQQLVNEEMNMDMPEEVLLDENEEVKRCSFYKVCGLTVSPNERLLAYFQDTRGNEFYTLKIKEIRSGKQLLRNEIRRASVDCAWSADSNALFYSTVDERGRPYKVWRHYLNESPERDTCIYREISPSFSVTISKTRDLSTICVSSESKLMSECRVLDANNPDGDLRVVLERMNGVYYHLERYNKSYVFCIQDEHRLNSEITIASVDRPEDQTVLIPCHTDRKIEDFILSRRYLTIFCRRNGLQTAFVYILPHDVETAPSLNNSEELRFEEAVFSLRPGPQGDFDSEVLRLIYTSLITPESVIDQHLGTFDRCVKKMEPVLGGYDETEYRSERTWALASDGIRVPISVVYGIDAVRHDGTDPLLLEVYGAYEKSLNPCFSNERLSLLQRGVVYAIAHVRGGGEMGRMWYDNGKLLKKKTTFTDTLSCARHLIDRMYCSPSKLCIRGSSAGGLTVGAALNMMPELFCAAIMRVPFVDVLTSMADASLPLTAEEWGEWGNPDDEEHYKYIKTYSPMDNITHKAYPHMLLTAGYHDFRVGYWEPAKFAAKVRDCNSQSSMVLFKCDMDVGHGSGSSRFQTYRDAAEQYAFLMKALNCPPTRHQEIETSE